MHDVHKYTSMCCERPCNVMNPCNVMSEKTRFADNLHSMRQFQQPLLGAILSSAACILFSKHVSCTPAAWLQYLVHKL